MSGVSVSSSGVRGSLEDENRSSPARRAGMRTDVE